MSIKQYKINEWWGINCITLNNSMSVEVIMLQVPWQEVVESTKNIKDKDTANNIFKHYVDKYSKLV